MKLKRLRYPPEETKARRPVQAPGTGILRLTEVPTENRRRALILLSLLPQKGSTLKLWSLLDSAEVHVDKEG